MPERLFIGAMSGTSADGVDVVLVRISGRGLAMKVTLLGEAAVPFPLNLQRRLLDVRSAGSATLREVAGLTHDVTLMHADAIDTLLTKTKTAAAAVTAVAAHGQTLFHDPPLTVQQFDPALLAARCGIDVVSDFRRADCAAGGQGAPLVPWADYILFGDAKQTRVVVNLGGIANVTILPAGATVGEVSGFDCGPANCLSDWILRDNGGIDEGGRLAHLGRADRGVVDRFMEDDYVRRPPPKSTDGPLMIAAFERAEAGTVLTRNDRLATAAAVVAECVLRQVPAGQLIAAGGGTRNRAILDRLRAERDVVLTLSLGVPTQSREAIAFALLGASTIDRVPANLPRVTGAARPVVLGALTPKP